MAPSPSLCPLLTATNAHKQTEDREEIQNGFNYEEDAINTAAPPGRSDHRRRTCDEGCGRPASVCLCPYLPPAPLHTRTSIVILHHPHELKYNKLATLPLLSKSLSNLHLISGRRLHPHSSPLLTPLQSIPSSSSPVLFLYPFPNSIPLSDWVNSTPPQSRSNPTLILVDGTWNHAREMATGSLEYLSKFAVNVKLEGLKSELVLKKEPFEGCVSTIEAVARAIGILESKKVEESLIGVLRAMVGFQDKFMKPMNPRPKLVKKGKRGEGGGGV